MGGIKIFRRKCRMGNLLCCVSEYFRFRKILDKMGGEYPDFPSKVFCLRVPKSSVGDGILHYFISFGYRESLDERGGGEYQDFRSNTFCLRVPKSFVGGEFFIISLVSAIEKNWMKGGGEYQDFRSNTFCLRVPKSFVGGEFFLISLFSGIEKVWIREGSIKIFRRKLFVSPGRKIL